MLVSRTTSHTVKRGGCHCLSCSGTPAAWHTFHSLTLSSPLFMALLPRIGVSQPASGLNSGTRSFRKLDLFHRLQKLSLHHPRAG
jgi:hypothetical protein